MIDSYPFLLSSHLEIVHDFLKYILNVLQLNAIQIVIIILQFSLSLAELIGDLESSIVLVTGKNI